MKPFQKIIFLFYSILLITFFFPLTIHARVPAITYGAICNDSIMNVYSAPDRSSLALGTLKPKEKVLVYSFNENWTCLLYDGFPAYVPTDGLSIKTDLNGPFVHTGIPTLLPKDVRLLEQPGSTFFDYFSGATLSAPFDTAPLQLLGISGSWLEISIQGSTGFVSSSVFHFTAENADLKGVSASPYVPITEASRQIWDFFLEKGLSEEAAAGLLGNLYAESALNTINLENTYEEKLGYTDHSYTYAIDHNTYPKDEFIYDRAGYGICQWTSVYRKQELYEMSKEKGVSIADLDLQLAIVWEELTDEHAYFLEYLSYPLTLRQASDAAMVHYLVPSLQNSYIHDLRLSYCLSFYEAFHEEALE